MIPCYLDYLERNLINVIVIIRDYFVVGYLSPYMISMKILPYCIPLNLYEELDMLKVAAKFRKRIVMTEEYIFVWFRAHIVCEKMRTERENCHYHTIQFSWSLQLWENVTDCVNELNGTQNFTFFLMTLECIPVN